MLPRYASPFPNQQQNSTPSQGQPGMNNTQIPMPFNGNNNNNNNSFMNMPNPQMGFAQQMGFVPNGFPARGFGPNSPQFNQNTMNHPGQFYSNQFGQFNPMQMQRPVMPMQVPMQMQMQMGGYQAPQNPGFMPGPQFGNFPYQQQPMNQNRPISLPMPVPIPVPPMNSSQGNSVVAVPPGPVQSEEVSKNFGGNSNGFDGSRRNWKNQPNNNNPRRAPHQGRPQNSRFNNKNTSGHNNFKSPNSQNGRGKTNDNPGNFGVENSMDQGRDQKPKRSLALTYSEQEIKQWREERKRNFPSKENVEKKLNKKMSDQEGLQKEAQIRRERLKEILSKQAELGVEVAEIPRCYISDPKKQGRNKFDKRGINDKRGRNDNKRDRRFNKKQRHEASSSSTGPPETPKKKPPTLLQKLLSSDMKRDKSHLLQAFRFMVMNSFFGDSSGPLKFPIVVVKDRSEETVSNVGKDVSEITDTSFVEKVDECNGDSQEGNEEEEGEIY